MAQLLPTAPSAIELVISMGRSGVRREWLREEGSSEVPGQRTKRRVKRYCGVGSPKIDGTGRTAGRREGRVKRVIQAGAGIGGGGFVREERG